VKEEKEKNHFSVKLNSKTTTTPRTELQPLFLTSRRRQVMKETSTPCTRSMTMQGTIYKVL